MKLSSMKPLSKSVLDRSIFRGDDQTSHSFWLINDVPKAMEKSTLEHPDRPLIRISSTFFWHLSSDLWVLLNIHYLILFLTLYTWF